VLHKCGESVKLASKNLSMAHGSLSEWIARRKLPEMSAMPMEEEDEDEGSDEVRGEF
jgi:hypothetical protein